MRVHRASIFLILAVVFGGPGSAVATAGEVPSAQAGCDGTWQVQDVPNPTGSADLNEVSGTSPTDVWAVGTLYTPSAQALIQHWDGTAWAVAPFPAPGTQSQLFAVAALTPRDAWAVGTYVIDSSIRTLIMHWDGRRWVKVRSPAVGEYLWGASALSARDAWAVGMHLDAENKPQPLIMHWDGRRWSIVRIPHLTGDSALEAVSVISSTDVWAVGFQGLTKTLTMHWDGTLWKVVPSPNPGDTLNTLYGVATASPTDAWAVGSHFSAGDYTRTLALHWDGSVWMKVPSPNVGTTASYFESVWASEGAAWAVGAYDTPASVARTLTQFWDGSAWTVVISPNVGPTSNGLRGVWASSPSDVHAVGLILGQDFLFDPLALRYCTVG